MRVCSGESHYYQGNPYGFVNVTPNRLTGSSQRRRAQQHHHRPYRPSRQRHRPARAGDAAWYRRSEQLVRRLIAKWEAIIGVEVAECRVKQMKTKWSRAIRSRPDSWLNLELSKKPVACLEYIIVHEMVHQLERQPNDRFIAYMDKFMRSSGSSGTS